jgi:hypothetical protein
VFHVRNPQRLAGVAGALLDSICYVVHLHVAMHYAVCERVLVTMYKVVLEICLSGNTT